MKMIRTHVAVFLVLTIVMSFMIHSNASTFNGTYVMVNNQLLSNNTFNTYQNGVLLVPAKEFLSALGGTFSFDSTTLTGSMRQGDNEITFRLDNSIAKLNGKNVQATAPLQIVENRFLVPAQFVAEKLGAEGYMRASKNTLLIFQPSEGKIVYQVVSGDSLWVISQLFGTSINAIKQQNNLTSDTINIGQKLIIKNYTSFATIVSAQTKMSATLRSGPGFDYSVQGYLSISTAVSIVGKTGDWYNVITPKGNGYLYYTTLAITQDLTDSLPDSTFFSKEIKIDTSNDFVTYSPYTVQKGDNMWAIAEKSGLPVNELTAANNLSSSSMIYIGQILSIPVHNIAVRNTPGEEYGEVLDWFKQAQYVFPVGKVGKFIDKETGKSFMAQRTMGATHSDTETLTVQDTDMMKEIFGGNWNWNRRPFVLEVDGRRYAISVAGMPHAGVEGLPYLQNVSNRSDNWGYGPNYDRISGNGMSGHFDMYFLNCLRHKDNLIDPLHQVRVMMAGGLQ